MRTTPLTFYMAGADDVAVHTRSSVSFLSLSAGSLARTVVSFRVCHRLCARPKPVNVSKPWSCLGRPPSPWRCTTRRPGPCPAPAGPESRSGGLRGRRGAWIPAWRESGWGPLPACEPHRVTLRLRLTSVTTRRREVLYYSIKIATSEGFFVFVSTRKSFTVPRPIRITATKKTI